MENNLLISKEKSQKHFRGRRFKKSTILALFQILMFEIIANWEKRVLLKPHFLFVKSTKWGYCGARVDNAL